MPICTAPPRFSTTYLSAVPQLLCRSVRMPATRTCTPRRCASAPPICLAHRPSLPCSGIFSPPAPSRCRSRNCCMAAKCCATPPARSCATRSERSRSGRCTAAPKAEFGPGATRRDGPASSKLCRRWRWRSSIPTLTATARLQSATVSGVASRCSAIDPVTSDGSSPSTASATSSCAVATPARSSLTS